MSEEPKKVLQKRLTRTADQVPAGRPCPRPCPPPAASISKLCRSAMVQSPTPSQWFEIRAVWHAYRDAGVPPPKFMLDFPHLAIYREGHFETNGIYYADLFRLELNYGWSLLQNMPSVLYNLGPLLEYWFDDETFCAFLASQMTAYVVAKLDISFCKLHYYLVSRRRPDILLWLLHLRRADTNELVFPQPEVYFSCFFQPGRTFYDWYQVHVVEATRLAVVQGAFQRRIGGGSALYRHFSQSFFGESQLLRIIFQMAH